MGRAAAVLGADPASPGRLYGGAALFAALLAYDEAAPHLWQQGTWWDVAWIGVILIPATFALLLIALPVRAARGTLPVGLAFAALAAALTLAGFDIPANFARLAAAALLGWYFLLWFETVGWVVLVACVIPWVDAYSVWRGPTKAIVNHHEHVFTWLSFAFPVPGEHAAAHLGLPDLLFFALFLAAAAEFRLRVYATWAALVASLAATIALATWLDLNGLPALPGLSLGFLLPNADLLWRRLRNADAAGPTTEARAP